MKDISLMNINEMLPVRAASSHKGTFGTLGIVAGCGRYRGAAVLSSLAAVYSGAGIVKLLSVEEVISAAATYDPSMVFFPLGKSESGCISMNSREDIITETRDSKSLLVGCGMSMENDVKIIIKEIIEKYEKTLVLDADALNMVSLIGTDILKKCVMTPIITPHIGEMARLTGTTAEAVGENMEECAKAFSLAYSCVTVLKSHRTVISDKNGETYFLDSPNPALSTAGSGDVLAGIISGLSVQGISPIESALLGVYIHSEAGKCAAKKYSTYSVTGKSVAESIPEVFLGMGR